jgi:hypothetical protein
MAGPNVKTPRKKTESVSDKKPRTSARTVLNGGEPRVCCTFYQNIRVEKVVF